MVIMAALALGIELGAAPPRRVERCHVTVQLPSGWVASPGIATEGGGCRFGVSSQPRTKGFDVTVDVSAGNIDDAEALGLFRKDETGWFTEGRMGVINRADEIKTPCCIAIKGRNEVGRYGKAGYLGMGEMLVAFIVGNGRTAWLQSSVERADTETFDPFVQSLRFVSQPTRNPR
jgi:hypothetical protein